MLKFGLKNIKYMDKNNIPAGVRADPNYKPIAKSRNEKNKDIHLISQLSNNLTCPEDTLVKTIKPVRSSSTAQKNDSSIKLSEEVSEIFRKTVDGKVKTALRKLYKNKSSVCFDNYYNKGNEDLSKQSKINRSSVNYDVVFPNNLDVKEPLHFSKKQIQDLKNKTHINANLLSEKELEVVPSKKIIPFKPSEDYQKFNNKTLGLWDRLNYKVNKTIFHSTKQILGSEENTFKQAEANKNANISPKKIRSRNISEFKKDSIYDILTYKSNSKTTKLNKTMGTSFNKGYSVERKNIQNVTNINIVKPIQVCDANGFSITDGNKNSLLVKDNNENKIKRDRSFAHLKNNTGNNNLKVYKLTSAIPTSNPQVLKTDIATQTPGVNVENSDENPQKGKKRLKYCIERSRDIIGHSYVYDDYHQKLTSSKLSVLLKEHMKNNSDKNKPIEVKVDTTKSDVIVPTTLVTNNPTSENKSNLNSEKKSPVKINDPLKIRSFSNKRISFNKNSDQIKDILEGKYSKLIKSQI